MTMLADQVDVVVGVDTHKHTHTGAIVMANTGAAVCDLTVPTRTAGYARLLELATRHGERRCWAIEGTATYGAGLTRFLHANGERVVEIDRPARVRRRNGEKSDPQDAVRAAREVLARDHLPIPRSNGVRAAIAVRLAARRSAVDGSRIAQQQLQALVVAAPEPIRARFRELRTAQMLAMASRLRCSHHLDCESAATLASLRSIARRQRALVEEAKEHEAAITELVRSWRPDLLEVMGVGPIVAATVLCAWSHKGRVRNDGAFARLAGAAPIQASSGLTDRHRLNRFGDRQLNRALRTVVVVRIARDADTKAYVERRTRDGKNSKEIKRCLVRYVARELYRLLEHTPEGLDKT